MKLAVSNIAWTDAIHDEALAILLKHRVRGVEVAPTRLWPAWQNMSISTAERIRKEFVAAGLEIPAMQSLLYGIPQLNIFGDDTTKSALSTHLERLFPVARALGVRTLVFGSPRNRDRSGLTNSESFTQAVEFFRRVAQHACQHDVILCVEPNPPQYGANFITNWREALALVKAVDTDGFGLHLDTGCIYMNGDDPAEAVRECRDAICHFHVSEPLLADFSSPEIDHQSAARSLRDIDYEGWVSIEMRCGKTPLTALDGALEFVASAYFGVRRTA
jgi:D-psicose/D-tagatose/L-ribulose 3-epimerase